MESHILLGIVAVRMATSCERAPLFGLSALPEPEVDQNPCSIAGMTLVFLGIYGESRGRRCRCRGRTPLVSSDCSPLYNRLGTIFGRPFGVCTVSCAVTRAAALPLRSRSKTGRCTNFACRSTVLPSSVRLHPLIHTPTVSQACHLRVLCRNTP